MPWALLCLYRFKMPQKISSKEVLSHLNELGYINISRQQLKEFIQDLKLLIRHDQKKKRDESPVAHQKAEPALFTKDTISSKAKCVSKSSVISVQVKRPQISSKSSHCMHLDDVPVRDVPSSTSDNSLCKRRVQDFSELKEKSVQTIPCSKLPVGQHSMSARTKNGQSAPSRPTTSFIRTTISLPSKSDPVALYNFYQAEWKKQKIPGEDSHSDLRWVIRERMLKGPRTAY